MESEQKYIEDEFELDEYFLKQMHTFELDVKNKIASKIDELIGLKSTAGKIQSIAGYINLKKDIDIFFVLDYYREADCAPTVLIDVNEIEVDRYLDYINYNKYIK